MGIVGKIGDPDLDGIAGEAGLPEPAVDPPGVSSPGGSACRARGAPVAPLPAGKSPDAAKALNPE